MCFSTRAGENKAMKNYEFNLPRYRTFLEFQHVKKLSPEKGKERETSKIKGQKDTEGAGVRCEVTVVDYKHT